MPDVSWWFSAQRRWGAPHGSARSDSEEPGPCEAHQEEKYTSWSISGSQRWIKHFHTLKFWMNVNWNKTTNVHGVLHTLTHTHLDTLWGIQTGQHQHTPVGKTHTLLGGTYRWAVEGSLRGQQGTTLSGGMFLLSNKQAAFLCGSPSIICHWCTWIWDDWVLGFPENSTVQFWIVERFLQQLSALQSCREANAQYKFPLF